MADRSIAVRLRAEVADFKRQMDEAAKATKKVGDEGEGAAAKASTATGRMVQSATQNREAWDQAGTTLTTFGAVATAAFGATVAAAVSWESSWAGVLKTVDGTPAQLAQVEEGLRGLTKVLPASHGEIAAVAEAAGQLGVSTGEVVDFTKVMIDLGETTNLSSEEAATALARFSNIMGTSQSDVGKLGSALVGLGNNYATTEREIVDMSMRLAGAGRQMGLNEGQVLGLAAAMSSVGIEAEAGGTAMSTVMKKIDKAVDEGGASLETFARVSGMSSQDFRTAWEQDASGSLAAFIMGLQGVEASGESVNALLSDLGVTGIRESDALLRLSAAGTLALDAMTQGVTEYTDATALIDEANKRYETAESKIQIAKNAIMDAAIDVGGTFLPMLADAADGVANLANWFGNLPTPIQATLGGLTGLTGVLALVAGGFLLTFPRVVETYKAFQTLSTVSPGLATGLGRVGKYAKIAAIGIAAIAAASPGLNALGEKGTKAVGDTADALQRFAGEAGQGKISAETLSASFSDLVTKGSGGLSEFGNAVNQAFSPNAWGKADQFVTGAARVISLGLVDMTSSVDEVKNRFLELDKVISVMDGADAAAAFQQMAAETDGTEQALGRLLTLLPNYKQQLTDLATGAGLATDDTTLLGLAMGTISPAATEAGDGAGYLADSLGEVDPAAEASAEAIKEWSETVSSAGDSFGSVVDAYQAVIDKNKELATSTADATDSAEDSWEDFYDGTTVSIDDWIVKLQEQQAAVENWAANYQTAMQQINAEVPESARTAHAAFVEEMVAAGESGAAALQAFVDGTPAQRQALVDAWVGTNAAVQSVMGPPPTMQVQADTSGAESSVATFAEKVFAASPTTYVWADTSNAQAGLGAFTEAVFGSNPTSYVYADTGNADSQTRSWMEIVASTVTNTKIGADDAQARGSVNQLQEWVSQQNPSILTGADDSGARSTVGGLTTWAGQQKATVSVTADTSQAEQSISWVARARTAIVTAVNAAANAGGGGAGAAQRRAGGGEVRGPGTTTSDSIPALLSDQEWVIKASSARKYGPEMMRQINDGTFNPAPMFDRFARFRDGGQVGVPAPSFRYLQPSVVAGGRSVTNVRTFNVTSDSATDAVRELSRREALMEHDLSALAGEVF